MPATQLSLADHLAAIVGAEHVRSDEAILTASPADTQQVSEVLRYANQNGLTVTPTGGNTKHSWGNPSKTDLRLDLTRLNRVIEHPWQDLTCTVQAGCIWQRLQQTLAKHGQFVALDPLWPERATVGGILATNDSGALRHRYGSLRDLVIGMTLVLADGTIARSGGKVVKNVAGYDLCKLITGSLGTLAVVTEATFRLHPLPQHTHCITYSALQATQLAGFMHPIRAGNAPTQAIQLRGDQKEFFLDIQLSVHLDAKPSQTLSQMTEVSGVSRRNLISSSMDVWHLREELFDHENRIAFKATMLPVDVPYFADLVKAHGGYSITQAFGIMTASVPAHADIIKNLRKEFESQGGFLSLLQPYEASKTFGKPPNALPLMQTVKHHFDPNRTLNPGRFLGGI